MNSGKIWWEKLSSKFKDKQTAHFDCRTAFTNAAVWEAVKKVITSHEGSSEKKTANSSQPHKLTHPSSIIYL